MAQDLVSRGSGRWTDPRSAAVLGDIITRNKTDDVPFLGPDPRNERQTLWVGETTERREVRKSTGCFERDATLQEGGV